jgi:hypothetical protein
MYSLIVTALCRARHKQVYADRRTMPSVSSVMFAANRAFPASSAGCRWLALGIVLMLRGRSGIPKAGRFVEIARP